MVLERGILLVSYFLHIPQVASLASPCRLSPNSLERIELMVHETSDWGVGGVMQKVQVGDIKVMTGNL